MAVTNNKLIGAVGLAVMSVVLAWRILVTGLAEYYVGRDTPEADAGALRWRSDQSVALYRQGFITCYENRETQRILYNKLVY